jgi:hypothetical protein
MNEGVALVLQDVGSTGLDDLLALVGLPSRRRSDGELSNEAAEILKGVSSFIDGLLLRAIAAQTKSEFDTAKIEAFMPYARTLTALAKLIRVVVQTQVIERVVDESFCEIEADFRDEGLARFGEDARDQAMLTVWSLRRTSRLLSKLPPLGPIPEALKEQDKKLANDFGFHAAWAQFHLDCLLAAIRHDKPIQLDVMPAIMDGLRAAVNAYGYAVEGLDLRVPRNEPDAQRYEWDDEDEALLASSMHEMETRALGTGLSWNEQEAEALNSAAAKLKALKPTAVNPVASEPSPIFGTHIREGIEIVKDWIENPKPEK